MQGAFFVKNLSKLHAIPRVCEMEEVYISPQAMVNIAFFNLQTNILGDLWCGTNFTIIAVLECLYSAGEDFSIGLDRTHHANISSSIATYLSVF